MVHCTKCKSEIEPAYKCKNCETVNSDLNTLLGTREEQCDAQYKLYDKNKTLILTFFCLKRKGHCGDHEHNLEWHNHIYDSIMGA
jgi:hypothetical protein